MDAADTRLCLLLHSISELDDRTLCRLLLHFGSPRAFWESDSRVWARLGLAPEARAELTRLRSSSRGASPGIDIEAQLRTLERVDASVLPVSDDRYPVLLRTVYDPPPLLYLRGNDELLQQATLAVVGSRRASSAGLRAAQSLGAAASAAGLNICSGLALGIDGAAHRGALEAGGCSIAVMATGIEQIYPRRHRGLAEQLLENGCLLTEFPPGMQALRHHFPRRNRIISGLSLGVLVVEAALPSGSLITAGTALEQGREVFALPWSPYHPGGCGCLRLIRDGAKMVQGLEDILEELGPLYSAQRELFEPVPELDSSTGPSGLPAGRQLILRLVGYEPVTVDELVLHSALPVAQVLAELSFLELAGSVVRTAGGYIHG